MAEKFFWADQIADKIIKEKGKKKIYVCASGITPSGTIHIGNFREVITTDLVFKALRDKGVKAKFIYSWDDYDRLRKVPKNIPEEKKEEFRNYIGMPVSDVPNPFGKGKYARYFEEQFEKECRAVMVEPEFIRQNEMYKKCKYAEGIKKAIDNKEKIRKILDKYRKEPLGDDWEPFAVYCEKCDKDFTKAISVEGYEIEYECECGFRGKFDFRKKGNVKLNWRSDWPMRWDYEKVDFEPGGIDHSVPGGSFTTAKEIVKEVYGYEAPKYQLYEWVRGKGGTEFSSSAGNVMTLSDVLEVYEPEILRYLFVSTRPNKGFAISFDNDVVKIYEDFDALEHKYFSNEATAQEKRIYELSVVNVPKKKPERIGFRHLTTLVQTGKAKELKGEQKKRAEKVANWLDKYAGDDVKFEIKDKIEYELSDNEKRAMIMLKEALAVKDYDETELFSEFNEIANAVRITNKEFFQTAYTVIIGKTRGPRLASLILTIGKDKIIKLLEQVK